MPNILGDRYAAPRVAMHRRAFGRILLGMTGCALLGRAAAAPWVAAKPVVARMYVRALGAGKPSASRYGDAARAREHLQIDGGSLLYVESTGSGEPILFVHDYAGDYRSWKDRVRYFSRHYQCITFNARGYPPSDGPDDAAAYGYRHAIADRLLPVGMPEAIVEYADSSVRRRFRAKDPHGYTEFLRNFAEHSAIGSALTATECQMKRPSLYQLDGRLQTLHVPALVIIGADDSPTISPALFLKDKIPDCQLAVFPNSSHAVNLEEPELFNRTLDVFFRTVERRNRKAMQ